MGWQAKTHAPRYLPRSRPGQARSLRDEARRLIAPDPNPCMHRPHQRRTHNLAEQNTFQAMYGL